MCWPRFQAVLLVVFGGVTDRLIPLYAVGAFLAFTLSQAGMVVHWKRRRERGARLTRSMDLTESAPLLRELRCCGAGGEVHRGRLDYCAAHSGLDDDDVFGPPPLSASRAGNCARQAGQYPRPVPTLSS